MLEEYLCMGGNEVANNARTYGYATTAGCPLSWFRCEPCESIHDVTTDWIPPTYRTYEIGRNIYPDPSFVNGSFLNAGVSWTRTFPEAGVARLMRIDANPGRIVDFIVGTEMPNSSKTVTIRFVANASRAFQDITVAARPNVAGATGEWAIASIDIPAGISVVEVTGPSFAGTTSNTSSGITLLDPAPSTAVDDTLEISEVMVSPRPALNFQETRRNYAVSSGMGRTSTTGTVVSTRDGASSPTVLVGTNLMIDPSARNAGVAGVSFITDAVTAGAALTRVANPPALPGAEFAAHFQVSNSTYRIGFVTGTALAINTQYTVRFRMAGNPTTAADGVTVPLAYRPGGPANSGNQVILGNFPVRATESVVQATFTTPAAAPNSGGSFVFAQTNGRTAGGVLEITEVTLVAGAYLPSTPAPFFDGSTPDTPEYEYAWTGTANQSTSTATLLPQVIPNGTQRVTQTVQGTLTWWDSFTLRMATTTTTETNNLIPVTPGQIVRLYAQWRGNDRRRIRFVYRWYDSAQVMIGSAVAVYAPAASTPMPNEWSEFAYELPPVPAGTAYVWATINSGQPGNANDTIPIGFQTGDWMEFRRPQIAIDQPLDPFFDGSSLAPDGYTQYNWTGTAWASASVQAVAEVLPALPPFFDGDSVEETPNDNIRWLGTPDASTSVWERTVVEFAGHSTEPPYTMQYIQNAPWFDAQDPDLTGRFYGVFLLSIENLSSSTRTAAVTEGILDGGVVGLVRHSTREMRVRALLAADGEDALEYGLAWLNSALAADGCSTHGASCGAVDMNFFASCPESPDPDSTIVVETPEARHMHNVTVISGPLVEQKIKSNDLSHWGYLVEWTMVAGTPWVFSQTKEVSVSLQPPVVVQDVPYNLVPFPSAELSSGTVTLATNYSVNPSVETDASSWVAEVTTITPAPTGARSTEIAAQGTASFKVAVTTTNSGTNGTLRASQVVTLPAEVTGQRFSINMWGFMAVVSGTAVLGGLRLVAEWRTAANAVLRTDSLGTAPATGGAISATSLTRPATAANVRVYMMGDVTSWSSGAVLNLFADALAVTIP